MSLRSVRIPLLRPRRGLLVYQLVLILIVIIALIVALLLVARRHQSGPVAPSADTTAAVSALAPSGAPVEAR